MAQTHEEALKAAAEEKRTLENAGAELEAQLTALRGDKQAADTRIRELQEELGSVQADLADVSGS